MKSSVKRNISWTQDWKNQSQKAAQVIKKLKKKNLKQFLTNLSQFNKLKQIWTCFNKFGQV